MQQLFQGMDITGPEDRQFTQDGRGHGLNEYVVSREVDKVIKEGCRQNV